VIKPQLLSELNSAGLDSILDSPNFSMSQKLDGRRLIVETTGLRVNGWARSGLEAEIPKSIRAELEKVRSDWIFDGELIDKKYYVFDILKYPGGALCNNEWKERQAVLNAVLNNFSDQILVVPQMMDPSDKRRFFNSCYQQKAEGVVFCDVSSKYLKGMRSSRCLKYKFKKTIDCFIIDKNIGSKDNLVLALYDKDANIVDVGKVSALTGDGKYHDFQVGEVVAVEYLYATEANRLYQPVKPKLRKDKRREECLMNQMIHKGKMIVSPS
jgi:ATP-dependent DNA ligase